MAKLSRNKLMDRYRRESIGRGLLDQVVSEPASEFLCAIAQSRAKVTDAPYIFTIENGNLRRPVLPREQRVSAMDALRQHMSSDFSGRVVVDGWSNPTTARLQKIPRPVR